jgi:hypothetical protein
LIETDAVPYIEWTPDIETISTAMRDAAAGARYKLAMANNGNERRG